MEEAAHRQLQYNSRSAQGGRESGQWDIYPTQGLRSLPVHEISQVSPEGPARESHWAKEKAGDGKWEPGNHQSTHKGLEMRMHGGMPQKAGIVVAKGLGEKRKGEFSFKNTQHVAED